VSSADMDCSAAASTFIKQRSVAVVDPTGKLVVKCTILEFFAGLPDRQDSPLCRIMLI
jgi:hypothetical protein